MMRANHFTTNRITMAKKSGKTAASSSVPSEKAKGPNHAKGDPAVAPQEASGNDANQQQRGLTWLGRVIIFLVFPTVVGCLGLCIAQLSKRNDPYLEVSFDRDFALPFVLALAMSILIFVRTRGFRSAWPNENPLYEQRSRSSWPEREQTVTRNLSQS